MRQWFQATLAVALLVGGSAHAGLVISIPDINVQVGGSGYLDVMIASSDGLPVNLAQAGYEFQITRGTNILTMMATETDLQFVSPQPSIYMTFSNYVFPGSGNVYFGIDNGRVSSLVNQNDDLNGGDNNLDTSDPVNIALSDVKLSAPRLLIRLSVTADLTNLPGVPPKEGDTFSVNLIPPAGQGTPSDPTFFLSADGTSLDYTSTTGTVTITARAVPEPGSLAMLGLGITAVGIFARRRSRLARFAMASRRA